MVKVFKAEKGVAILLVYSAANPHAAHVVAHIAQVAYCFHKRALLYIVYYDLRYFRHAVDVGEQF